LQARIDLNADLGESFGAFRMGDDQALVPLLTSANVACGFHAGDPVVIDHTVRLLKAAEVALGAHPGFADLVGFGRRDLGASYHQIETDVAYQVAAVAGMGHRVGLTLRHVKAHGALYNLAWKDENVAAAIAAGVASLDADLILVAPGGSALERAAGKAGLRVAREAFADRAYTADGTLVPRHLPGAVLDDPHQVAERAVEIACDGQIAAVDGSPIALRAETICIHGDNPAAVILATAVREALKRAGVVLWAMSDTPGPVDPDRASA